MATTAHESLLLTYSGAAKHLRLDRSTIYRLVADHERTGFPQPIRVGHAPRFRRADIEAYIAAKRAGQAAS